MLQRNRLPMRLCAAACTPVGQLGGDTGSSGINALFHFTMTPAPNFAGLRRSPIQQVYQ
jgi:hypothetical protein